MEITILEPIYAIAPIVLGGLIAGGASLLGTAISTFGSKEQKTYSPEEQAREQSKLNKEQALMNYQYGEQAADAAQQRGWDTYEKYQTPLAMREQLEKAGMNPALMYGSSGGVSGGTVQQGNQGTGAQGIQPGQISQMVAAEAQQKANNIQMMLAMTTGIKNLAEAGMSASQAARTVQEWGITEQTKDNEVNAKNLANQVAGEFSRAQLNRTGQDVGQKDGLTYFQTKVAEELWQLRLGNQNLISAGEKMDAEKAVATATKELTEIKKLSENMQIKRSYIALKVEQWMEKHKQQFKVYEVLGNILSIGKKM